MGSFADEMDQECSRIIEYLNIKEPTVYDRVDYVYPIKQGYRKVFYYTNAEKDKLWHDKKEKIINRTDSERLQRIISVKMIRFEEEKNKQAEDEQVQQHKITILRDKIIPYLRRFTETIYSCKGQSIEEILM